MPLAGDTIRAIDWDGVNAFTPQLLADTTDPTLGAGAEQEGFWVVRPPNICRVWVRIRFGTSGVDAGSGNYQITLPFAVADLSSSGTTAYVFPIGSATFRDHSTVNNSITGVAFVGSNVGGPGGVGMAEFQRADGTIVDDDSPWVWAAEDAISFTGEFPANI